MSSLHPASQYLARDVFRGMVTTGVVIDNNDPMQLLRCRVRVSELHRDIEDDKIPWALPMNRSGISGQNGQVGSISVPAIGTKVFLEFLDDNLYNPAYTSWRIDASSMPAELLADYPNVYGFIDAGGNTVMINTEAQTIRVFHVSGSGLSLAQDGKMEIFAAKDVIVHGNAKVDIRGSQDITVHSGANVDIRGQKIDLNKSTSGNTPTAVTVRSKPPAVAKPAKTY